MECKCKGLPLPEMYLSDTVTAARMAAYASNQGPVIEPVMGDDGPYLFYNANDFISMLQFFMNPALFAQKTDALRIYFAVYGNESSPGVPEGFGNMFTFLFAPAFSVNTTPNGYFDSWKFYNIAPGGPFNPGGSEIDPDIASAWVSNWQKGLLTDLPVDQTPANYDEVTGTYSDTRSLVYLSVNLSGFLTEIQCQQAYGIKLYLSTYTEDDPNYPKRLGTIFILTDADGNDIQTDTSCRPKIEKLLAGYDTGSPCPPTPGCTGSSLPKNP